MTQYGSWEIITSLFEKLLELHKLSEKKNSNRLLDAIFFRDNFHNTSRTISWNGKSLFFVKLIINKISLNVGRSLWDKFNEKH